MVQLGFDELWGEQNRARLKVVGLYKALNRVRGMSIEDPSKKASIVKSFEDAFVEAFDSALEIASEGSVLSAQLEALRDAYTKIVGFV